MGGRTGIGLAAGYTALDLGGGTEISGGFPYAEVHLDHLAFTPIGESLVATIVLGVIAVVGVAVGTMFRQRRDAKKRGER
jgi:hypothetical protein